MLCLRKMLCDVNTPIKGTYSNNGVKGVNEKCLNSLSDNSFFEESNMSIDNDDSNGNKSQGNNSSFNVVITDNNNIIGRNKQCCYSPINCARKLDFSNVVEYTSVSGNNNNNGDERNSSSTNIKITNNNITTTTTTTTTANTKNVVVPISKSINKIKLKCNCSSCKRIFSIVNGETTLS